MYHVTMVARCWMYGISMGNQIEGALISPKRAATMANNIFSKAELK